MGKTHQRIYDRAVVMNEDSEHLPHEKNNGVTDWFYVASGP